MAVQNGMANVVACIFADAARTGGSNSVPPPAARTSWAELGHVRQRRQLALGVRRHMALYGTTSEQLGWIAVTCRKHAAINPNAVMREPITLEDHQKSRLIVDPLHMLDCCLITDGGGLHPGDLAGAGARLQAEAGVDPRHGPGPHHGEPGAPDWWYLPHQARCIADAYKMAGVSPADINVAQLYDNFTVAVLFWLEHAGFCKTGEAGPFVEGGKRIALDGELPVNTAGGNLSESYMQGWLHVVEGVRQLRGECGQRQVTAPRSAWSPAAA